MSIAEFLDGMPSYNKRNFSCFHSNNGRNKNVSVYISTNDSPCDQIIVCDKSNLLIRYLKNKNNKCDKKQYGGKKRELVEEDIEELEHLEEPSRKLQRLDIDV